MEVDLTLNKLSGANVMGIDGNTLTFDNGMVIQIVNYIDKTDIRKKSDIAEPLNYIDQAFKGINPEDFVGNIVENDEKDMVVGYK